MQEPLLQQPKSRIEKIPRRRLLRLGAVGAAALLSGEVLAATPEIPETEDNMEGPFYKAGAPERSVLAEPELKGVRLSVTGRVLSTKGAPLAGALLDVWQADSEGRYDNEGFTLRGRLRADRSGHYRMQTIVPRFYRAGTATRPAHIHVKVSAPGFPLLTTQLYFKGAPYNNQDRWVRASLMLDPKDGRGGKEAQFDFVLRAT